MKKRTLSLALAAVCAFSLLLTSCGNTGAKPTATSAGAATAETPAPETDASHYPVTITTYNFAQEPVEFTFEKAPERVYADCQNNIETLLALGLGDKIVGCSGLDDEARAKLGDTFAKLNYYESMPSKEEVLGLTPDFISGWYGTFSDKLFGDVGFWQERGIGTYMSLNSACRGPAAENPQTVEEECQDILTLGKIFDVEDKAQAIVDEIHAELDKINAYVAGRDKLTVAILEDGGGTYRVYGEDVLGGNVAMQAGAELAVGKHGENGDIGAEDLIAANPDAIFMVWYNGFTVGDVDYAGEQVTTLITGNPAFASLDAVKNNRVFAINLSRVYCSGMRTLDGVLDFAKNLYPELYQ
ncbi:MAG: hypothetical protein EOM52_02100 [Clostridia bacterium]|nr:hypothetical protein [Clostridia bacterium]